MDIETEQEVQKTEIILPYNILKKCIEMKQRTTTEYRSIDVEEKTASTVKIYKQMDESVRITIQVSYLTIPVGDMMPEYVYIEDRPSEEEDRPAPAYVQTTNAVKIIPDPSPILVTEILQGPETPQADGLAERQNLMQNEGCQVVACVSQGDEQGEGHCDYEVAGCSLDINLIQTSTTIPQIMGRNANHNVSSHIQSAASTNMIDSFQNVEFLAQGKNDTPISTCMNDTPVSPGVFSTVPLNLENNIYLASPMVYNTSSDVKSPETNLESITVPQKIQSDESTGTSDVVTASHSGSNTELYNLTHESSVNEVICENIKESLPLANPEGKPTNPSPSKMTEITEHAEVKRCQPDVHHGKVRRSFRIHKRTAKFDSFVNNTKKRHDTKLKEDVQTDRMSSQVEYTDGRGCPAAKIKPIHAVAEEAQEVVESDLTQKSILTNCVKENGSSCRRVKKSKQNIDSKEETSITQSSREKESNSEKISGISYIQKHQENADQQTEGTAAEDQPCEILEQDHKPNKKKKQVENVVKVQCFYCEFQALRHQNLMRHMKQKHRLEPSLNVEIDKIKKAMAVKCSLCDKILSSEKLLKYHIDAFHKEAASVFCEICDKTFKNGLLLRLHIKRMHENRKKDYLCHLCPVSFTNNDYLRRHVATVHCTPGEYKCDKCDKVFASDQYMRSHRSRYHSNKSYKCKYCGQCFQTYSNAKRHIDLKHEKVNVKPYVCGLCNKEFSLKFNLQEHMRYKHWKIRRFQCEACEARFDRKDALDNHSNNLSCKRRRMKNSEEFTEQVFLQLQPDSKSSSDYIEATAQMLQAFGYADQNQI